jgi:hypothetical protein
MFISSPNYVVLQCLPIFCISFSQLLQLRRIQRTSDQMLPSFTSGIDYNPKLHVNIHDTRRKPNIQIDPNEYVTVKFKFHRKMIYQMH